jgi:hypothetical protein
MANFKRIAKWVVGLTLALSASLACFWWYELRVFRANQTREAAIAIEEFHRRFNAGEFDRICDEAIGCSGGVRKDWNSILQDVADRAGKFREVRRSEVKAYIEPFQVRADYVSSFDKTDVREIFILNRFDSAHVRILNYLTPTNPALPADRQEFK